MFPFVQEKHQQQKDAARSIAIMQGKKNDKLSCLFMEKKKSFMNWEEIFYFYEFTCLLSAFIWITGDCNKLKQTNKQKNNFFYELGCLYVIADHLKEGHTWGNSTSLWRSYWTDLGDIPGSLLLGNLLQSHHRCHRVTQTCQCHF